MTIDELIGRAAELFEVSRAEIVGRARPKYIIRARFAVSWVASRGLGRSSVDIGQKLGDRDHTTILDQIERATAWRGIDLDFRRKTDALLKAASEESYESLGEPQYALAL